MKNWKPSDLTGNNWMPPLQTNRGGYTVTMRECSGAAEVLTQLVTDSEADGTEPRLHVGWGSFRNLDIIASRQSSCGLLLDVNVHQFKVWQTVFETLEQANNATEFVRLFVDQIPKTPRLRQFDQDTYRWITSDFDRKESWLYNKKPERFLHIKNLISNNKIHLACLDMRGGNGRNDFLELATNLLKVQEKGVILDTLYISNIPWMLSQPKGFFGEDHDEHMPEDIVQASTSAHDNLYLIAQPFHHLISAMHLAPEAKEDDLRWDTRLYGVEKFFQKPVWQEMLETKPS